MQDSAAAGGPRPLADMSTQELVIRSHTGDGTALNALLERYRPRLLRLAHGRLPTATRRLNDTGDIVQNTLIRAFKHMERFDHRGDGAFLAWLWTILRNEIIDQGRRALRRPDGIELTEGLRADTVSPLEHAIGAQNIEIYERALAELPEIKRHAVAMRFEYQMAYEEIAMELSLASANAARMMIQRATLQLAERMRALGGEP